VKLDCTAEQRPNIEQPTFNAQHPIDFLELVFGSLDGYEILRLGRIGGVGLALAIWKGVRSRPYASVAVRTRPYPFESVRDNFKVPSLEFKVESGFGIEFENGTAAYARTIFSFTNY
jgi:hypothetical protein